MADKKKWGDMTHKEKIFSVIVLAIFVIILLSIFGGGNKANNSTSSVQPPTNTPSASAQSQPAQSIAKKPSVPVEYTNALVQAAEYANTMNMSKQGVYDQLVSQYGGQFSAAAANYAIDNVKADWNANALAKAKEYQSEENMSPAAIHDQLVSSYGEKFTEAEADYAIQHLND